MSNETRLEESRNSYLSYLLALKCMFKEIVINKKMLLDLLINLRLVQLPWMTSFRATPLPSRGISILFILFVQPNVEGLEELQDGSGTHFPVEQVLKEHFGG